MVGIHHEAPIGRNIFQSRHLQLHIAGSNGKLHNVLDVPPFFFLGIFFRSLGVLLQLRPQTGYAENILNDHQSQTVHSIPPLILSGFIITKIPIIGN